QGKRKFRSLEDLVAHVGSRALDVRGTRLRVEARLLAQRGLFHHEVVQRDVEVRAPCSRRHVALKAVARDDVVVSEARQGAPAPYRDDDERGGGIDAKDGSPVRGFLLVEG